MEIKISTLVKQEPDEVLKGFDLDLFQALKPPLLPLKVEKFDGCKTGDLVHLNLGFGQRWNAKIVDHGSTKNGHFFIDEGTKLPFPLREWRHRHGIDAAELGSKITDHIHYRSPFYFLDLLLFPALYLIFYWRKRIYQRRFS